jgi:poly(A) polymerase
MEDHPQARWIVETLARAGFVAYYAGGWVRDFLLRHPSDDIDIATNAPPETIQALFPKTVPIGIAFGIILVIVDGHEYEVATFRRDLEYKDGRRPSKITFATAEEDAHRRDFTMNGMFFDPLKNQILDFVGGQKDLQQKLIRAIGNPHERIREDRLRMIRAIRLSCRFQFSIHPETEAAIRAHARELFPAVAVERIVQEMEKGRDFGKLHTMLLQLHSYDLLSPLFPSLEGVSLDELERRLRPLTHFPVAAPLFASILELFPEATLSEQMELGKRLKLPNSELQFAAFLFEVQERAIRGQSTSLPEWAHLYAHPCAQMALEIAAARLSAEERDSFHKDHDRRRDQLAQDIRRIRSKEPLVQASDLQAQGIAPGPQMGLLLKEAERLAIEHRLHSKEEVLVLLRRSPLWQKKSSL